MSWKVETIRLTGKRHRERGMLCQDNTACRKQDGRQAIALVDGIGQTDVNAEFGKMIAKWMTSFLLENYEEIQKADDQTIAYNLMLRVERILYGGCKEFVVKKEELSSTLLGAAIDQEANSYCLIHLGDGIVAARSKNDKVFILSGPMNGKKSNETILSTSEGAMKYVKI